MKSVLFNKFNYYLDIVKYFFVYCKYTTAIETSYGKLCIPLVKEDYAQTITWL